MNSQDYFGIALRDMRQALGLSQLALASRLSSTQRHISFLETGRSRITREFLQRLVMELNLSASQRGALFAASGYANPYPNHDLLSDEMTATLDMIETRVLAHWPFPAFALDADWTVLRANTAATRLFAGFGVHLTKDAPSLLEVLLSPQFRSAMMNWEDASVGLYFRLQRAATHDASIKDAFEAAKRAGTFDHIPSRITGGARHEPLAPARMRLPDGTQLQMTPLVGKLAVVQDVRLEQIEIEFMVPVDDATSAFLSKLQ